MSIGFGYSGMVATFFLGLGWGEDPVPLWNVISLYVAAAFMVLFLVIDVVNYNREILNNLDGG